MQCGAHAEWLLPRIVGQVGGIQWHRDEREMANGSSILSSAPASLLSCFALPEFSRHLHPQSDIAGVAVPRGTARDLAAAGVEGKTPTLHQPAGTIGAAPPYPRSPVIELPKRCGAVRSQRISLNCCLDIRNACAPSFALRSTSSSSTDGTEITSANHLLADFHCSDPALTPNLHSTIHHLTRPVPCLLLETLLSKLPSASPMKSWALLKRHQTP